MFCGRNIAQEFVQTWQMHLPKQEQRCAPFNAGNGHVLQLHSNTVHGDLLRCLPIGNVTG